jgi:predicted nucleotidyltransferase component of viral defense system
MQEAFLEAFFQAGAPSERFYLSGGTALSAYYLQHRYSDDLDLFTRDQDALSVGVPLVEQLVARLGLGI